MRTERRRGRAAMLLEVIVAMTIFVGAVGVLASQLLSGLKMVEFSQDRTKGSQLADRIMGLLELDPQTMQRVFVDQATDGDFGDENPGWFWRVQVEPTEIAGLGQVSVEVLHQEDPERRDDISGARVVRSLHMLKADPGKIDLQRDFGVDDAQLESFAELAGTIGIDPTALDPHAIVQMPPDQLLQLIPTLLPLIQQFMGGAGGGQGGMPPGLAGLLGQMQGGGGGQMPGNPFGGRIPSSPGNMSQDFLRNFIQQQLGDRISSDQLDGMFNNGGGGRGGFNQPGGFPGGGNGPGNGNRPSSDEMREVLRNALGDQVSEAELDQLIEAYESNPNNQGNGNNNNFPPPVRRGGNRGGGGDFGGNGGNGGQTINDFNNNRNNRNNGGRRGGRGGGGGGRGGGGGGRGG